MCLSIFIVKNGSDMTRSDAVKPKGVKRMYLGEQFKFNENECYRSTRMEVSVNNLRENFRDIKNLAGGKEVIAAVKGNAYSIGIVPVSKILYEEGCLWFAVAIPEEALLLRREGIDREILLLGPTSRKAAEPLVANNIICACGHVEFAEALAEAAEKLGKPARVHLKIDSGMGRFGFLPDEAVAAAKKIASLGILIEGAFTHFATSEEKNLDYTKWQFSRFMETMSELSASGIKIPFKHVCNSGATLSCPDMYLDGVRAGKLIYGIPIPGKKYSFPIRPTAQVKTAISAIRHLPARSGISYGLNYTTRGEQRIGLLPMGTYDGLSRLYRNVEVLVRGVRVPVVGTICMDQSMIDLTMVPDAQIDDEVVVLGKQGNDEITLTELTQRLGSIYSQVLALFPFRMPRFYV